MMARYLKLRLLLEGIEVPCIAAVVNITANAPAQCQIQIPATDKSMEFIPKTLAHVFFWDPEPDNTQTQINDEQVSTRQEVLSNSRDAENPQDTGPSSMESDSNSDSNSASNISENNESSGNDDDNWKLFFTGEIIGVQISKDSGQRSTTLHCLDLSNYWDTCYQYRVNVANLTGDGTAAFVGAGTTLFDTFFSSTTSSIIEAMNRRSITQPNLNGLLSGIVRLLEAVGGVYTGNESQSTNGANPRNIRHRHRGVNDYFSIAELRLGLVYQITAAENDDSSKRSFARQAFSRFGRRRASRLGKISSFREILNLVMQYIYHAVFPCPIPKYRGFEQHLRTSTRRSVSNFSETSRGRQLIQDIGDLRRSAASIRTYIQSTEPQVNVVRARLRHVQNQGTLLASRSREHSSPAAHLRSASRIAQATWALFSDRNDPGSPVGVVHAISAATRIYQRNRGNIDGNLNEMVRNIGVALHYFDTATQTRTSTRTREVTTKPRLHTQIIRPDVFMVSPPRCNVIFPEYITSMNYQRMYLREVTRMRLTVTDEIFGPNALLNNVYYAPDIKVMGAYAPRQLRGNDIPRSEERTLSRAAFSKRLMKHELATGVVPIFERLNEINVYSNRSDDVEYHGMRVPYVVRAINHQFFKHRWQPRQMSVQCKFMPWVVAGFPALIMDRNMTKTQVINSSSRGTEYIQRTGGGETLYETESGETENIDEDVALDVAGAWDVLRENVPNQFIGLIEGMQHVISQNTGATSLTLSHARVHRENEELLGSNSQELTRRSMLRNPRRSTRRRGAGRGPQQETSDGRARRTTAVAALEEPVIGQVGPWYGEVIQVTQITRTGNLQLYGTYGGERPRRGRVYAPVGITQPARFYGDEVVTMVGDPNREVTLTAYEIVEAVDRWVGQTVSVPLEDFVRPPWMSDVWKSAQIGSTYHQLFGTGAITDDTVITVNREGLPRSELDPVQAEIRNQATRTRTREATDPDQPDGGTRQEAGQDINIERATDLLVRIYSMIRHEGLDVHEFIRTYNYRPVATLPQILGSRDLKLDEDGRVVEGTMGFHSLAFGAGPLGQNLRNLVDENVREILGWSTEPDRSDILERLDLRAAKSERVMAYVRELWDSRGLLG